LHLVGKSSRGKTTALQIAASVWGSGKVPAGYARPWRATGNALEGMASSANDTLLALDEIGEMASGELGTALYSLGNGSGKTRMRADASLREAKTWRVLTFSTGELQTSAKVAESGRKVRAGQEVRMLNILIDRPEGLFDHAGATGNAGELAQSFKRAAGEHYGHAGPEFVRRIQAEGLEKIAKVARQIVESFCTAYVPVGADGQIRRAAQRLGLIGAAGEISARLNLISWPEGRALEAATWALETWIAARGGAAPLEDRQALEQIRAILESDGESRFDAIGDSGVAIKGKRVNNRLGWRVGEGQERLWLVPPEI